MLSLETAERIFEGDGGIVDIDQGNPAMRQSMTYSSPLKEIFLELKNLRDFDAGRRELVVAKDDLFGVQVHVVACYLGESLRIVKI